jgi:hypothetical protein
MGGIRLGADRLEVAVQAERAGGVRNQQRVASPDRKVVLLAGQPALAGDRDENAEARFNPVAPASSFTRTQKVKGFATPRA